MPEFLNAIKGKFVGESEASLRRAFQVINATGRCVVWIDELEKALGGAIQGAADGGVSTDALGALLSWMQDRVGEAFITATANDVSGLPPEMLRAGRWDAVWWVDLPTAAERAEILAASLRTHKREVAEIDLRAVAAATPEFSGPEIAALVPAAMFTAFADGVRQVMTDDLLAAAAETVPLAKTADKKIEQMRTWAKGRARPASAPEAAPATTGRALDL